MALAESIGALSLANHDFSLSLYKELAKTESGNILFSPLSIHVIMFMASIGAASKTYDEIITTLHLKTNNHSLEAYRKFLDDLNHDGQDKMKLVTGMFVDTSFNIKNSFVENSKKYCNSTMEKLNFKDDPEQQRQYLNNWVLTNTNNKIKDIFPKDSINKATALILANAVHFKSPWASTFDEVKDDFFYVTPNNRVTVKMMTLLHKLQYYHDKVLKFAALELPYEFHDFKLMILLPDAKDGLKDLEHNLSKIKLHEISKKTTEYEVTVKLPRFKIEQSLDLKKTVSYLGCPTMFTKEANFSRIVEVGDLYVSKIVHKAFIDVNENGTEAAAASGMELIPMSLAEHQDFVVDHPFIFFILSKSGSIIFVGRMTKID